MTVGYENELDIQTLAIAAVERGHSACGGRSADFQSAVSQGFQPASLANFVPPPVVERPADWKSAIQRSAARPQPNGAKRMECVELAPAFVHGGWSKSASKLDALHTLREIPAADKFVAKENDFQR